MDTPSDEEIVVVWQSDLPSSSDADQITGDGELTESATIASRVRSSRSATDLFVRSFVPPTILFQDGTTRSVQVVESGSDHLKKLYIDTTGYKYFSPACSSMLIHKALCDPKTLEGCANDTMPLKFQGAACAVVKLHDRNVQQSLEDDGNGRWSKMIVNHYPDRRADYSEIEASLHEIWSANDSDDGFHRKFYFHADSSSGEIVVSDYAVVVYSWNGSVYPHTFPIIPASAVPVRKSAVRKSPVSSRPSAGAFSSEKTLSAVQRGRCLSHILPAASSSHKEKPSSEVDAGFHFSASPGLETIRQLHDKFVNDRGWNNFHTPRNLLLAMVGEVGEVSELFQWKGECEEGLPDWSAKEKQDLGDELSDVLIYLIRLAQKCNVDLPKAVERKMQLNALKYPADVVYGSSKKYTEYQSKKPKKDE